MTNRGSMLRSASLLLTAILMLAGCGKAEEQKTAPPPPAPATATAPQAAAPTPQATAQAPQAAPAPSAPAATPTTPAATVLASADGEWPNVRVEVQELKRSSGTVMLRFTVINDDNKGLNVGRELQGTVCCGNVSGVSLVDTGNKKKYLVVVDSANKCLCSDMLVGDMAPKTRMNLWAKFPAPPDDVKKISVSIPHFAPMDDVPIGG